MSTLYLPLKKEWYNMIESGEKKEEYREINDYWKSRLMQYSLRYGVRDYVFKPLDEVRFSYGYTKKTMTFKIDTITIGRGKQEWGAPTDRDVFIIKLGEKNEMRRKMKECVKLQNAPEIPQEVLEKQKVTIEEIHEALCKINKRRIEDNKSNIKILFNRIFKRRIFLSRICDR